MDDATFHTARTFAHDPAVVWRAFEDPRALAAWWGPAGFRNTFSAFDFREGGEWRLVMHAPGGADHPNLNRFQRLEPRQRVVALTAAPMPRALGSDGEGEPRWWAWLPRDSRAFFLDTWARMLAAPLCAVRVLRKRASLPIPDDDDELSGPNGSGPA